MWSVLKNYSDGALLFLRITLGGFFIYVHGWPNLAGGQARWTQLGGAMKTLGISIAPLFWGFLAACAESIGCVLFMIGCLFRPSCLMLFYTLTVAAIFDYHNARSGFPGFANAAHAIEMALVFFTLMFIGPGKFSIDKG